MIWRSVASIKEARLRWRSILARLPRSISRGPGESVGTSGYPRSPVRGVRTLDGDLVAAGLDMACAALVGNIVGAIKVSILGHRRHVGRQEIIQTLEALLA